MKKFCLALLLFVMFILPSFAKFSEEEILTVFTPLKVRNTPPCANSHSRIIATLPVNTALEIVYFISDETGEWYKIKWYSNVDKKYKEGWVEYPVLAINAAADGQDKEEFTSNLNLVQNAISNINDFDFDTYNYYKKSKKYDEMAQMVTEKIYNLFLVSDFNYKTSEDKSLQKDMGKELSGYYSLRAAAFAFNENYTAAVSDLDEAIFYNNTKFELYKLKGMTLFEQGYYSKAKTVFEKAKTLALKEGNEKAAIEINLYLSKISYQLSRLK